MYFLDEHKYKKLMIQLIFVTVALLMILYPLKTGMLFTSDDATFNVQRLTEVFQSLRHFQIPQYSAYSAYPMGIATATMYPWLVLALFTPFSIVLKPVELWYFMIFIGLLVGQNIAYFVFESIEKTRKLGGVLFALLYCNSYVVMGWIFCNSDIGAMYAIFFLPVVFAGWIHYLHNNQWKMMILGLLLISCCHLLSTLIVGFTLVIVTIISHSQFHKHYIRQGLKALIIFALCDACIWIPIIILLVFGNAKSPLNFWTSGSQWLFPPVRILAMPYDLKVWDYAELIALSLIIVYWKSISRMFRAWIYISIVYEILNIDIIWKFLYYHTPLRILQNTYRLNIIIEFTAMWVLIALIIKVLPHRICWSNTKIWILIVGLFIILGLGNFLTDAELFNMYSNSRRNIRFDLANQHGAKHLESPIDDNYNVLHNSYIKHDKVCFDYFPKGYAESYMRWNARAKNYNVSYKRIYVHKLSTRHDNNKVTRLIYRKHPYDSADRVVYMNHNYKLIKRVKHKAIKAHYLNHGLHLYISSKNTKLLMPIGLYTCQKYYITDNGHNVQWKDYHDILQINNLSRGWHNIQYHAPIMWYRYVALLLTLIGLLLLWALH